MVIVKNEPLGMLQLRVNLFPLSHLLSDRTPSGKILKADLRKLAAETWLARSLYRNTSTTKL